MQTINKWKFVAVDTTPSYETYYWTNSISEIGYRNRGAENNHAAADSALMLVSKEKGTEINDKPLEAIDQLTPYGLSYQGSHPGEAMEKATRIYQAVGEKDDNGYCEETGEWYYSCKRVVLYFADGTLSPIDGNDKLSNYPNNDTEGAEA